MICSMLWTYQRNGIFQKHRMDACFNCGDSDHGVPKCPKPIDQARIDWAKSEFSHDGGGCGGRGGCDGQDGQGRGCGHESRRGRAVGDTIYNHGKWQTEAKANAVSIPCGIGRHKGKWSMMSNHVDGIPPILLNSTANMLQIWHIFSLPATHIFWTMSGKTPPERGCGAKAPAVAIPSVATAPSLLSSRMGPLIAQYKTWSDDSQFSFFLADFKRVLN